MEAGTLTDRLKPKSLTVYTTDFDRRPPAPVTGLSSSPLPDGGRRLTWNACPDRDLCYYRIYRSTAQAVDLTVENQIGSTVATHYEDRDAESDREHHYRVAAVDQSGNSSK